MSSLGPNRGGGRSFKNAVPVNPGSSPAPSGTYSRKGASGRFIYHSRESSDVSADMSSIDGGNYTVHIPATPDHQPMYDDPDQGGNSHHPQQQQYVSNTMFTGGFNSLTRGHVLDKMTEAEGGGGGRHHHQSTCHMQGCDTPSLRNDRGEDIFPCECNFKICRDCYVEALKGDGRCPGCKEIYKAVDSDDPLAEDDDNGDGTIPLHALPAPPESKMVRRLSLVKSSKHHTMRNQNTSDFDHDSWLHETKGTYGYGNAVWPKDQGSYGTEGDGGIPIPDFKERARRPLTRKVRVPSGILSPYRLLVVIRFVALAFYLQWRIVNPNPDAIWLWGMSVVCELWFAFSWILDQMPKLNPINRSTDLTCLKEKFETRSPENPSGRSDLPGVDFFVSSADPEKEPPLVTCNTILSILACEYPVEKLACYLSDDGGALLSFEALAEAASFAKYWVPFCRKHSIEPRNPDSYFNMKKDPTKNKIRPDFIKDRRRIKREYDEYKVRINGLSDAIRRRSDAYNAHEEIKAKRAQVESGMDLLEPLNVVKATWMSDGTHWPGTWIVPSKDHSKGDHAGIIQVMLPLASSDLILGSGDDENTLDFSEVDIRLPLLVYMSREKRSGYDHNKKAGAMNALVRSSAIISNGPFILNLDCDHYINNSTALREGICFMLDRGGENVCYVQFPQRFEGIDTHDRYANHNTVFFDGNMRALDGLQGPMYVGTGCLFRRIALYGFDPPRIKDRGRCCGCCVGKRKKKIHAKPKSESDTTPINSGGGYSDEEDNSMASLIVPKRFGSSNILLESIPVAEFQGRPLADHPGVKHGRPPGALINPHEPIGPSTVAEALSVISCWFEGRTEWGRTVGWIYGSVTEDVVTGYCMHKKGWRSIYCVTKRDAFRGTAPINLTDRLHQVLRWATGSVEIFFSRNNGLLAGPRMKLLQGIAYLNVGIYPFTSIFLVVYCFLPALSLFTGQFIVQSLSVTFLIYLLLITITLCLLAVLEVKWSGITLEEWWRNEQFWLIGGTSAHLAAVMQGLLKVMAGVDISFTLTSKSTGDDEEEEFADLYVVRWTSLMIPPLTIMLVNMIAIAVGIARTIYSTTPEWSKLLGGTFFSLWVLVHLYPFAKGLMGRRGRTPTILWVWAGLLAITISLLWVAISNPNTEAGLSSAFQIP